MSLHAQLKQCDPRSLSGLPTPDQVDVALPFDVSVGRLTVGCASRASDKISGFYPGLTVYLRGFVLGGLSRGHRALGGCDAAVAGETGLQGLDELANPLP